MKKTHGIRSVLGVAGAALLIALATAPASAQVIDELVVEQGSDTVTLDPQVEIDTATGRITQNIYDSLFRLGPDGQAVPHLAESYRLVDPLTWEIKLRRDVKFHDGESFNAESVKFSINRASDKNIKPAPRIGSYYTTFASVEVVDPYTVRIKTKEPDPIVPKRLTGLFGPMLPPGYIAKHGQDILKTKPVGTGPFKFVRWDKDEKLVLEANDQYWGKKAPVKRIVFKPVPEVTTRIADLQLGRADIVSDIPPDLIDDLKKKPNLEIKTVMSSRNIHLIINTIAPGPLTDKRVRQALLYAVDVDSIIKNLLKGYARRTSTLFVPESVGFDPAVKPYPYDPDRAKKLLAEAGYGNGFEVGFDVPTGRYLKGEEVAQAIAGQLAKVGVTAKIQTFEWGGFVNRWRARKLSGLTLIGAGDQMLDADQLLTSRLISDANYGGFYINPKLDELIAKGRKTTNPQERLKIYSDAQKIIAEDCPILPLYQQPNIYGLSSRIDWVPTLDENIYLDAVTLRKK